MKDNLMGGVPVQPDAERHRTEPSDSVDDYPAQQGDARIAESLPATLVEKLEALIGKVGSHEYEQGRTQGIKEAISIVQQHEVDLEVCARALCDESFGSPLMWEKDEFIRIHSRNVARAVLTAAGVKWRG